MTMIHAHSRQFLSSKQTFKRKGCCFECFILRKLLNLFKPFTITCKGLQTYSRLVRNIGDIFQLPPSCLHECAHLSESHSGVNVHTLNQPWRCERSHFSSHLGTFNSIYPGVNIHTSVPICSHSRINAPSINLYSTV